MSRRAARSGRRPGPLLAALLGLALTVLALVGLGVVPGWLSDSEPTGAPNPLVTRPPASPAPVSLAGRTIVLDPGHNGGNGGAPSVINRQVDAGGFRKACDTVGAQTADGYPEHAFTFDVAQRAATLLRSLGAEVVLTRADDAGVGPCVDERARIGNEAGADAVVSIHADGGPESGSGFHVIAPAVSPDGGNEGIVAPSGRLAEALRSSFAAATGQQQADYLGASGITVRSDLGGLNLSQVPKVFLECGNMRNPEDAARLSDPSWRQRAAQGIADGIARFLADEPAASTG